MPAALFKLFNDRDAELGGKLVGVFCLLIAANVLAWVWALIAFRDYPVLIGTAFLAYAFGLRHAVDADHIAAIDNVTRKLMQEGKRPIGVGFFFSLGHSTVVVLASAVIALTTSALQGRFDGFKLAGGTIGTLVSAIFLFVVAAANFVILLSVYRTFQEVRRGGAFVEEDLNHLLAQRGVLGRWFRPLFRLISRSWTCIRWVSCSGWASIPRPKSACSASPRRKPRKACRSGRSWYFPRCSPRACRSSIP